MADIPGLVEGAHKGVGLGDKFLRHIERCKILLHLIDLTEEDIVGNYLKIRKELSNYGGSLSDKKELIFCNKIDLVEKKDMKKKLERFKKKVNTKYEVISVLSEKDLLKTKKVLLRNVNTEI